MAAAQEYRFENVWHALDAGTREQVKRFWRDHDALPVNADADLRAEQVLFVVRDAAGEVGGVSSVARTYVPRLGDYFYVYRTFIAPALRRGYVARELLVTSRDFLQAYNESNRGEPCLGIFLEVEAESLKYGGITVKRAIWEDSRFVFIGRTRSGAHLRVYYFPGALIEPLRPQ